MAASGIAATLIDSGRTAHSALKLPLNINVEEYPVCNISKTSGQAKVLQTCKILVWDECTMAHKKSLEALDRTLRDLRKNDQLLGGSLLLLAGDFRQTLPVIPNSTPADELNACLKTSPLWKFVKRFTLKSNMRVRYFRNETAQHFAHILQQIGEGTFPTDSNGEISFIDDFCTQVKTVQELINKLYPDIAENYKKHDWLSERAILAAKNDAVHELNSRIQEMIPGPVTEYRSIDTVVDSNDAVNFPIEFLNSLDPPGMPPHRLHLKIGSVIILLRNLYPPKLCNGTRLSVKRLLTNIIEATILTLYSSLV
ncbi:hypothetical protein AVEN_96606-1 [Araneus ventricosus]|uniref:ATP-dependent DNA helicase n=1 Tax=Araneus ventricosus TaxID=182803 RepID=A0A4Y2KY42_ARAVE|nr:hypothetical protein AVEN_96606-1 [Araneus ventricosus]